MAFIRFFENLDAHALDDYVEYLSAMAQCQSSIGTY